MKIIIDNIRQVVDLPNSFELDKQRVYAIGQRVGMGASVNIAVVHWVESSFCKWRGWFVANDDVYFETTAELFNYCDAEWVGEFAVEENKYA